MIRWDNLVVGGHILDLENDYEVPSSLVEYLV